MRSGDGTIAASNRPGSRVPQLDRLWCKPTVLVLTHHCLDYEAPQVGYLVEFLRDAGANVVLLGPIGSKFHPEGIQLRVVPLTRLKNLALLLSGLWQCATKRCDLVVAVDEIAAAPALMCARLARAKRVVYFLDYFDDREALSAGVALGRWVFKKLHKKCDVIIDTNEHRRTLRRANATEDWKYRVLHNAAPTVSRMPEADPFWEDVPQSALKLIYTGAINQSTYLDVVIEALALYRGKFFFALVGSCDNEFGARLKRLAQDGLRSDSFTFVGQVSRERLPALLAGADVGFALYGNSNATCANERFASPNKVYEYMALGLPAIVSANPSMLHLVEEAGWGLCVQPDDPLSVLEAIRKMGESLPLRRAMSSRARELHLGTFNFYSQANSIFEEALGGQAARRLRRLGET